MCLIRADEGFRGHIGSASIRAFDGERPVARETILEILSTAGRAPSGSNIQPWHVYVVSGEIKEQITRVCSERYLSGDEGDAEYHYYPRVWREPYIGRRRQTGFGLYGLLGIERKDTAAVQAYRVRNDQFFDAPVGLFFTIDRDMELGSWLDYGMFLQSVMLSLQELGLESCAQRPCAYHDDIMPLGAPEDQMIVCGMSRNSPSGMRSIAIGPSVWADFTRFVTTEHYPARATICLAIIMR